MICPDCGSRGTPLPPHHFLRDSRQCGNPDCRKIYEASHDTADLAPASREEKTPAAPRPELRAEPA